MRLEDRVVTEQQFAGLSAFRADQLDYPHPDDFFDDWYIYWQYDNALYCDYHLMIRDEERDREERELNEYWKRERE